MTNEKKLRLIAKQHFDQHFKEIFEQEELPKADMDFLRKFYIESFLYGVYYKDEKEMFKQ